MGGRGGTERMHSHGEERNGLIDALEAWRTWACPQRLVEGEMGRREEMEGGRGGGAEGGGVWGGEGGTEGGGRAEGEGVEGGGHGEGRGKEVREGRRNILFNKLKYFLFYFIEKISFQLNFLLFLLLYY